MRDRGTLRLIFIAAAGVNLGFLDIPKSPTLHCYKQPFIFTADLGFERGQRLDKCNKKRFTCNKQEVSGLKKGVGKERTAGRWAPTHELGVERDDAKLFELLLTDKGHVWVTGEQLIIKGEYTCFTPIPLADLSLIFRAGEKTFGSGDERTRRRTGILRCLTRSAHPLADKAVLLLGSVMVGKKKTVTLMLRKEDSIGFRDEDKGIYSSIPEDSRHGDIPAAAPSITGTFVDYNERKRDSTAHSGSRHTYKVATVQIRCTSSQTTALREIRFTRGGMLLGVVRRPHPDFDGVTGASPARDWLATPEGTVLTFSLRAPLEGGHGGVEIQLISKLDTPTAEEHPRAS